MPMVFRQATAADAPAIAELYLLSRKTFLPYAPSAHSDDEVRQWMTGVLIPANGVTVVLHEGEPVGMMAIARRDQQGWIEQLFLHPSAVGRGLGSQLLARAKQALGSPIRLYIFQANIAARRFYERHGFKPIAFSDGQDNEERCPDILLEWQLPAP